MDENSRMKNTREMAILDMIIEECIRDNKEASATMAKVFQKVRERLVS